MSRIISIANQKGGTGKTTSTYNIATALAMRGFTVGMIDNDPQASLTTDCGYMMDQDVFRNRSTKDLYDSNVDPEDCCFTVDAVKKLSSRLYLVPSGQEMAVWEREIYDHKDALPIFAKNVRHLAQEDFDFIFIDCPPNLGALLIAALLASDEVIIPVETTYSTYSKLPLLISTINQIKGYSSQGSGFVNTNSNLGLSGVIGTRYHKAADEHNQVLNELSSNYNLLGWVKEAAIVTKNLPSGLPVVFASKSSVPAKQYQSIAEKILEL